jgi:hypothetical protein
MSGESVACSVGLFCDSNCSSSTVSKNNKWVYVMSHFKKEEQELLSYRTGLTLNEQSVICEHHQDCFINRYDFYNNVDKCSNPNNYHNVVIKKHLRPISLEFAKSALEECQLKIIPGQKLCSKCRKRVGEQITEQRQIKIQRSHQEIKDITASDSKNKAALNSSLAQLGLSPIKLHGVNRKSRTAYGRYTMEKVCTDIQTKVTNMLGIAHIDENNNSKASAADIKTWKDDSEDLARLMQAIKSKISTAQNFAQKVQYLTLVPESWSYLKVIDYFDGVTEHMIRTARELIKKEGILASPPKKEGNKLNEDVVELVESFYQSDENSRELPGKRDCVSVSRNVLVQKRLVLYNLRELYAAFQDKHPDSSIGLSKFCELRPKWCVIAGASGTHSVCICTIHQNLELLFRAIKIEKKEMNPFIESMMCAEVSRDCYLRDCPRCPKSNVLLLEYFSTYFKDCEYDETPVHAVQWTATDRCEVNDLLMSVTDFITLISSKIESYIPHNYVSKAQSKYLTHRKETMAENEAIILMDFSENSPFKVQNSAQGYHWNKDACALHPVVVYYRKNSVLVHRSLCFLSDDMLHDVAFVYQVLLVYFPIICKCTNTFLFF